MCGKAYRLHVLIDARCPTDSVGCWPVRITSCRVILGFFEYLLNWHWTDVFFTHIHLVPLITSKQSNEVSFKPLSSAWSTYVTETRSSTLSNAHDLNVLPRLIVWVSLCYKWGLNLKTFWENRSSHKTQRRAFKSEVKQQTIISTHQNLKSKRWNDSIPILRVVSSMTAKNDNLQQPVHFDPGMVGLCTKFHCAFNTVEQIS